MRSSRLCANDARGPSATFFLPVRRTCGVGKRTLRSAEPLRLPRPKGAISRPATLVVAPSALRVGVSLLLHSEQYICPVLRHCITHPIIVGDRPRPPPLVASLRICERIPSRALVTDLQISAPPWEG